MVALNSSVERGKPSTGCEVRGYNVLGKRSPASAEPDEVQGGVITAPAVEDGDPTCTAEWSMSATDELDTEAALSALRKAAPFIRDTDDSLSEDVEGPALLLP